MFRPAVSSSDPINMTLAAAEPCNFYFCSFKTTARRGRGGGVFVPLPRRRQIQPGSDNRLFVTFLFLPATKVLANSLQLQKQPAVSSSDKASSLAAKVHAVCKTSVPEASIFPAQRRRVASPHSGRDTLQLVSTSGTNHRQVTMVETRRLAIVTVVETPCSWSVQRGRVASHSGKDTLQRGTCFTISTTFMAIPLSLPKRSSACESHSHGLPSLGFVHYQHHQQDSGSGGRTGRWAP